MALQLASKTCASKRATANARAETWTHSPEFREPLLRKRLKQQSRLNLQRLRDLHDIHKRHVPLGALDLADVVPVETRQFREGFLREIPLRPQLPEALAEEAEDLVAHSCRIWT